MTDRLLYLIGEPGIGKSTLMRHLTEPYIDMEVTDSLVPHRCLFDPEENADGTMRAHAELGRRREAFSGTDALSMSIAPKAREWIGLVPYPLVYAEGDRLASTSFWQAARDAGYEVDVILLDADPQVAEARRAERGSNQGGTWLKGRLTKVRNLRPHATVVLDAEQPTSALVAMLRERFSDIPG